MFNYDAVEYDETNKAKRVKIVGNDIQIGAVELKDGDSDTRADIELDSAKNALYVQSESLATETTLNSLNSKDLMLGTDFSNVFGTNSVISATPAIKVEEQGTVTVQATQLDIDDLNATDDIVTVTGGVGQTADVKITLDGEPIKGTYYSSPPTLSNGDVFSLLLDNGGRLKTSLATALPAGTNNIGDVDVLSQPARAVGTDSIGAYQQTDKIYDGTTALTPKFAVINASTSGDNTLVAAVVGKKIRVLSYHFVVAGDVDVRFEDGAGGTALTGVMSYAANGGEVVNFSPIGHFETTANTLLNMELSAAVQVSGSLVYVEV